MRNALVACAALSLLGTAHVASAAPPPPITKEAQASNKRHDLYVLPLKIDAVTFVSSWTPCAPLPGYSQVPGSGNLLGANGFCGIASVRLKKTTTASLAGRAITILVSEQHNNITPWSTIVGSYTLPFPASGDTLTFQRVAVGSFPGDNPAARGADASNRKRQMDADYSFSHGRPVLVELQNIGQTIDKKNCTFKTIPSPSGPGTAQITCP
jgi:hypothetical protein